MNVNKLGPAIEAEAECLTEGVKMINDDKYPYASMDCDGCRKSFVVPGVSKLFIRGKE